MEKLGLKNDEFVRSRFPKVKCHRLESRGNVWYAITLNGDAVSLFDTPDFGGRLEANAWDKAARTILSIEAEVGTLVGRAR